MGVINNFYKRCIASDKRFLQIVGALIHWRWQALGVFVFFVLPVTVAISWAFSPNSYMPFLFFLALNIVVWLIVKVCRQLTDIFSLRKNEVGITWCYITILVSIVLWVIGFVLIFNIKANDKVVVAIGIFSSLLAWIFQERIKGAVTFIHLRLNHLLSLGDRIAVPKYDVNGVVKRISLTTVTIYNLDTTTSIIPISALQADHFINYQKMLDGKTYGRRMLKSFLLDTSWFRPLSKEETTMLRNKIIEYSDNPGKVYKGKESIYTNLSLTEIEDDMLNAKLYRIYIFHWLMNHKHISQMPQLLVRWKEHERDGLPLEISAFIVDSSTAAFECQQAQIVEHIIDALDWFGLRLYQSTAAFDQNYSTVYLSSAPSTHIKEVKDEL